MYYTLYLLFLFSLFSSYLLPSLSQIQKEKSLSVSPGPPCQMELKAQLLHVDTGALIFFRYEME